MNFSAETWLMVLALALYLYDTLLLLAPNELVLVHRGRGRWMPAFGAHGWKLAGKEPLLPSPWTPWQAVTRVRWSFEQGLAGERPLTGAVGPVIGRLPQAGVAVLGLVVFVALPLGLFVLRQTAFTLAVIAALYLCIAFVLLTLRRDWRALGLSPRAFATLCVECIACPPFCINAVRRASLAAPGRITLADAAVAAERAGRLDAFKAELARRISEQIDVEPEGSARMARLEAVAQSLTTDGDGA